MPDPSPSSETVGERWTRYTRTSGSPFKRVQRQCNFGLTNDEWNSLTYDQRHALVVCDQALHPRRVRVR